MADDGNPQKIKVVVEFELTYLLDQIEFPEGGYDDIREQLNRALTPGRKVELAAKHDFETQDYNTIIDMLTYADPDNKIKIKRIGSLITDINV